MTHPGRPEIRHGEPADILPVHRSGPVRPFALCHSYTAAERHTRNPAEVTCGRCLALMAASPPAGNPGTTPDPAGGLQCGHVPVADHLGWPLELLTCEEPAGHANGKPGERHKSSGYWWSERQQAPVQNGHIHSTGYLCSPTCPRYGHRNGADLDAGHPGYGG